MLGSDAVGFSWDFCAATVDYDVSRKEVSAIGCVLPHSCITGRAAPGALMRLIQWGAVAAHGVMQRHRCRRSMFWLEELVLEDFVLIVLCLLGSDAVGPSWDFWQLP